MCSLNEQHAHEGPGYIGIESKPTWIRTRLPRGIWKGMSGNIPAKSEVLRYDYNHGSNKQAAITQLSSM